MVFIVLDIREVTILLLIIIIFLSKTPGCYPDLEIAYAFVNVSTLTIMILYFTFVTVGSFLVKRAEAEYALASLNLMPSINYYCFQFSS